MTMHTRPRTVAIAGAEKAAMEALQSPMRRASRRTHSILCARRRLAPREAFPARVKLNNAPVRA